MRSTSLVAIAMIGVLIGGCLLGCAQNTETVAPQKVDQQQVTPTVTAQDLMTAGSDVRVFIINAPGASGLPDADGDLTQSVESLTPAAIGKTNAGYVQGGITLNITTGGTTPSATGTTTGTATATQNPNQTTSANPVQDIKPELTTAVPITVALPGSAASSTANAAGSGGQLTNPSTTNTQTPQYTTLSVPANMAASAVEWLKQLFAIKAAGGTPVVTSQPAE